MRRDLLRVHARAFNARDLETIASQYTTGARIIRDGELIGEGPEAATQALRDEYGAYSFDQVTELEGEPIVVQWDGETEPEAKAVLRFEGDDRITTCWISHDPDLLSRAARNAADL